MKHSEEVMSNAELVKDLLAAQELLPEGRVFSQIWAAMSRAITALSSQDDVREKQKRDYFNDTAQWRDCAFETAAQIVERYFPHGEWKYITDDIRALKSKPTTEERRTWTRADGTTSPKRTGEVDRRKSAEGEPMGLPNGKGRRDGAFSFNSTRYGRRKDDRARWTQPPAPEVKQGLGAFARDLFLSSDNVTRQTIQELADAIDRELDTRLGGKNV